MEIVKAFNSNDLHINILIKGTVEYPLFMANDIGNVLEIANMRTSIKDYNDTEKVVHTVYTLGGNQDVTFLTEKGLYKVLFKSRKPIAQQFQNWVCEVIKDIRLTGQYKLNKEIEELKTQLEEKDQYVHSIIHQNHVETHNKFLQLFSDNKVIYIILLKQLDINNESKYIIKIGKTEKLGRRLKEIAAEYIVKEPLILDVYESNNILKLEHRIHSNTLVKGWHYDYTTVYNKIATETYAVNHNELISLKTIIKDLQDKTPDDVDIDKQLRLAELQLQNTEMEMKNNELKLRILELTVNPTVKHEIITEMKQEIIQQSNKDKKEDSIITVRSRAVMGVNNPEVYQYDPADLSFIKKYNSQAELSREKPNISLNSLRNAIKNNTVYLGYRWVTVKRGETPTVLPTKNTVIKSHDTPQYIVRLNDDKTKILNVYASAKEGIEDMKRQFNIKTTLHSFNRPIHTGGLQFGFYWNYFDRCSLELQTEFLSKYSLPVYIHPSGTSITKICPTTGSTIQTFHSKMDAMKHCGISTRKLSAILNTEEVYQGFIWRNP